MRIAILSRGPRLYSTRRLKEAAIARGHEARVLNTLSFSIEIEQGAPRLFYKGRELANYDAVIPRIGASVTFFGTAVVRQFEQMGVFCVNPSHAISVARDKLRALQVLSRHRVGLPTTLFVRHVSEIIPGDRADGRSARGGEAARGHAGDRRDPRRVDAGGRGDRRHALGPREDERADPAVREGEPRPRRARVRGRQPRGRGDAAHRRGRRVPQQRPPRRAAARRSALEPEYERVAVHAAQVMGLRVAGVDLLEGRDGPVLIEVNSSPGLEAIEAATKVDVAGEIVSLIEEEVLFPEIDIRQRLTLQSGYGVIEVPVDDRSELCGKTIESAALRERDVIVLTIQRGSITIPNPKTSREILAGDVLLCFGKTLTLKSLAPRKTRKRRQRSERQRRARPGSSDSAGEK